MMKKQRITLDKVIVLLFLTALMGYMTTARPTDRYVWIGTLAILLLRTAWLAVKRMIYFRFDCNLFLYILFFVWGITSCFWAKNTGQFRTYAIDSFPVVVCAVMCLAAFIGHRMEPDEFNYLFILAGVLAAARFCCYTDWSGVFSGYYMRGTFGGLLDNVTNYNNYTMIISGPCILAMYYSIVRGKRWFYPVALVLLGILFLGGSRKNIITMPLIGVMFSMFVGDTQKKLKSLTAIVLAIAVGIYVLCTVPTLYQLRDAMLGMFTGLFNSASEEIDASTMDRMYLIRRAMEVWVEHPVTGVGWHNYRLYNDLKMYSHNNYTEMLACFGIIGFLLYYAIFFRVAYIIGSGLFRRRFTHADLLLIGFSLSVLIMEIGSITVYFKERLIIMLIMLYWHSYATKRKIFQLTLK